MQSKYKLLIVGGSAGSFQVLYDLVAGFKRLTIPAIIILHRKSSEQNLLVDLLASKTKMQVKEVEDKETLLPGNIYVAPPDYHLLIEKDKSLSLDLSAPVNFSRPCIDVSFETAAEAYGDSLLGILLSGANSDGANGLVKIASLGGTTVIQDPKTAQVPFMPEYAISLFTPDHIINGADIPAFIGNLIEAC